MSSQKVASITKPEIKGPVVNGVPTGQLLEVIGNIQQDAEKALVSCLATTMVYHAAVQGIVIESVESQVEGDIDVRGFFGLSDEVRKGAPGSSENLDSVLTMMKK